MAHFGGGPVTPDEPHDPVTAARNARIGLWLFTIYLALYGGFVLINAFVPRWMAITPLWGINLAILYGMGLIVAAVGLSLVYCWLCRRPAAGSSPPR